MSLAGAMAAGCRREWVAAAGLSAGALTLFAWLSKRSDYLGNLSDSAVYLVVAEVLSGWAATPHPAGYSPLFDYQFPPLYPLLLGLLGGGAHAPSTSYLVDAGFNALVVGATFLLAARLIASLRMAAAAATVLTLTPGVMHHVLGLYSESIYTVLVLTSLTLALDPAPSRRTELAVAFFAGLCVLARSAGLGLVAALVVCRLRQTERRRDVAWWCLLLGPALMWQVVRSLAGAEQGYSASILRGSLGDTLSLLHDAWLINMRDAVPALARLIDLNGGRAALVASAVMLLFALPVWFARLRRWQPDAWYVCFYGGLVSLWPYPDHLPRFLLPLLPLLLIYCLAWGKGAWCRNDRRLAGRIVPLLPGAALLMAAAPATHSILATTRAADSHPSGRYMRSPQWYGFATAADGIQTLGRIEAMMEDMREIDKRLPGDACVSSAASPYVLLYGRRRALKIPPANASARRFRSELQRCPYVFMMAAEQWPSHGYPAMYPYHRITDELDVMQVRLWDADRSSGRVRTMLARFRPHEERSP